MDLNQILIHYVILTQAIGVIVQNGYGLSEASPVVAARRPNCNVSNMILALEADGI